jgi:hypothetical protein
MPRLLALCIAAALALPAAARADDNSRLYRQVLRSVVWINVPAGGGRVVTGTGSLVDRSKRLVLTNFHVVGDNKRVKAIFPQYHGERLIAEREEYVRRIANRAVSGEVIDVDRRRDLALVRLDRLPDSDREDALPLSADGVSPGQTVHSIGNPGKSGALWVYTPGKVRQVYHKQWRAELNGRPVPFEAEVIETDSPTNPGDSGGPLVNDAGHLVGVTQGGAVDAQALSYFIDLSEVKRFLNRNGVRGAASGKELAAAPPKAKEKPRTGPVLIKDDGQFFGEEAVKKANAAIAALHKKKGADLIIETFAELPKERDEKLKAAKPEARDSVFQAWAEERAGAEKTNGMYVLVCKSPRHMRLYVTGKLGNRLPPEELKKVVTQVTGLFRQDKYDEGLAVLVKAAEEKLGGK